MATVQASESVLRSDTLETLREIWLKKNNDTENAAEQSSAEQMPAIRSGYGGVFEKRLLHSRFSEGLKEATPTAAEWWLAMQTKSQRPAPIGTKRGQDAFRGTYDTGSGCYVPPSAMRQTLSSFDSSESAISSTLSGKMEPMSLQSNRRRDSAPLSRNSQWEPPSSSGYSSGHPSTPDETKSSLTLDSGIFPATPNAMGDSALPRLGSYNSGSSSSNNSSYFGQLTRKQFKFNQLQDLHQEQQRVAKEMLELERKKKQLEESERLYKNQILNSMTLDEELHRDELTSSKRTLDRDFLGRFQMNKHILEAEFSAIGYQRAGPLGANPSLSGRTQPKSHRQQSHSSIMGEQGKPRAAMWSDASSAFSSSTFSPKTARSNSYEEALELLENEAKNRRTLACLTNATLTWKGDLKPKHYASPTYASKVFVGGLPHDVTSDMLSIFFGRFGATVQLPPRGRRHAYLVFESELQVRALLDYCECRDNGKFYIWIPSRRGKERESEVIPWATENSDWLSPDCLLPGSLGATSDKSSSSSRSLRSNTSDSSSSTSTSSLLEELTNHEALLSTENLLTLSKSHSEPSGFSKQNTVFVGALHGEITAEGLQTILSDLFGPIIHVGIDTDKNRYPNGSARVTFASTAAFRAAVLAEYVEVVTPRFTKTIQLDAYIEDGACYVCHLATPVFCRHPDCFRYYCATCFDKHRVLSIDYHPPVMRNRNRGTSPSSNASSFCFNSSSNSSSQAIHSLKRNGAALSIFDTAIGLGHFHKGINAAI